MEKNNSVRPLFIFLAFAAAVVGILCFFSPVEKPQTDHPDQIIDVGPTTPLVMDDTVEITTSSLGETLIVGRGQSVKLSPVDQASRHVFYRNSFFQWEPVNLVSSTLSWYIHTKGGLNIYGVNGQIVPSKEPYPLNYVGFMDLAGFAFQSLSEGPNMLANDWSIQISGSYATIQAPIATGGSKHMITYPPQGGCQKFMMGDTGICIGYSPSGHWQVALISQK